jgi:predicted permease
MDPGTRFPVSTFFCRALLRAYPGAFRERFGPAMLDDFADLLEARSHGRPVVGRFESWCQLADDVLRSAPGEHVRAWRTRRHQARRHPLRIQQQVYVGTTRRARMAQDIRDALRRLGRNPGFTVPILLSIAFAIGANVAAFSIINTLSLRTVPVREPDQLFVVAHGGDSGTLEGSNYAWYEQVRDRAASLAGTAAMKDDLMKVVVQDQVESLAGVRVSGSYFPVLGVVPALGRLIVPADQPDGSPNRVAVISDAFWTRRFGRDPAVLGRTIVVDQVPHEIVGVTPPGFFGLQVGQRVDVTIPMDSSDVRQGWTSMPLIARLPATSSSDAATAELTTLFKQFVDGPDPMGFGKPMADNAKAGRFQFVTLTPLANGLGALRENYLQPALVLMALVGLMLLLACANWATLSAAKASARRRDTTICLALGSTRFRLVRASLVESLLLSLGGGLLGFLAAWWTVGLVANYIPSYGQPVDLVIQPDLTVLAFALAVSLLTGLLFGVAPAWLTGHVEASELRTAGVTQDRRSIGLGNALVVVQVALSLVLVVAATFFMTTLRNLRSQELGFSGTGVITFDVDAEDSGLEGEALTATHRQILDRLRALPGVERVTLGTIAPLSGNQDGKPLSIPGFVPKSNDDMAAQVNTVGPDYLETFGIPLVRGRAITAGDTLGSPRVVLVSEAAARHFFPGADPIGRRFEIRGARTTEVEVVGIVRDVRDRDLRRPASRMFYVPFFQRHAEGEYTFAIRASNSPAELMRLVRREIHAVAPGIPVPAAQTLAQRIDDRLVNERLLASVAAVFGAMALLVAAIGIYGVVAYAVSRRTPELGLRLALGAGRRHVSWLVIRSTLGILALGTALGLAGALASRRFISSLLFGVLDSDPRVYAAAVTTLAVIGLLACLPPVLRLLRLDPMTTLRRE